MTITKPKLTLEVVPQSNWGVNLRSRLSQKDWDKLRKAEYRRAKNLCEICGSSGLKQNFKWPVECHEIWHYDDSTHIQALQGLLVLCPRCHQVKHFMRSEIVGLRDQALLQLMTVNGWNTRQAEYHVEDAKIQWAERSRFKWTLDLSWLSLNKGLETT